MSFDRREGTLAAEMDGARVPGGFPWLKSFKAPWPGTTLALSLCMAKSWGGFLPQNQHIIQQWGYMEASTSDILKALRAIGFIDDEDAQAALDNEQSFEDDSQ